MCESTVNYRARLYEKLRGGLVKCLVCERRCILKPGKTSVCKNYLNSSGNLIHLGYGVLSAVESRPIEIKPLFHFWPNSTALTFSGYGCNFYCPWCQNNHLSFSKLPEYPQRIDVEELVELALKKGDEGLCASFNEPAVLFDYLLDLLELGKRSNLYGVLVTNGYFTEKALKLLVESGANGFSLDLKGCPEAKSALASIDHLRVLRNGRLLLDLGAHIELIILVVPEYNDREECIEWMLGKALDLLGSETPIHINRYYPAHVWKKPPTPLEKLIRIKRRAEELGFSYVYVGNTGIPELEFTKCPECGKILVTRTRYRVTGYYLDGDRCPRCGRKIPLTGRYVAKKAYW